MSLVIDASVACAWFMATPYSDNAETYLIADDKLIAPDLIIAELCNTAWKLARGGHITAGQADDMASRAQEFLHELVPLQELSFGAYKLSRKIDHPAYDCFYLTLAQERGTRLITADKRLAKRAIAAGYGELVQIIASDC